MWILNSDNFGTWQKGDWQTRSAGTVFVPAVSCTWAVSAYPILLYLVTIYVKMITAITNGIKYFQYELQLNLNFCLRQRQHSDSQKQRLFLTVHRKFYCLSRTPAQDLPSFLASEPWQISVQGLPFSLISGAPSFTCYLRRINFVCFDVAPFQTLFPKRPIGFSIQYHILLQGRRLWTSLCADSSSTGAVPISSRLSSGIISVDLSCPMDAPAKDHSCPSLRWNPCSFAVSEMPHFTCHFGAPYFKWHFTAVLSHLLI